MPLNVCSHCQEFFITKSLRCCVLSILHSKLLNVGTLTPTLSDCGSTFTYTKVSVDSQFGSLCHYMNLKTKLFKFLDLNLSPTLMHNFIYSIMILHHDPQHVSSFAVLIFRRTIVYLQYLVSSHSVCCHTVHRSRADCIVH
jgi:hypothetical protein